MFENSEKEILTKYRKLGRFKCYRYEYGMFKKMLEKYYDKARGSRNHFEMLQI